MKKPDLTQILRVTGGIALTASAAVFLVQGYSDLTSFYRFGAFFALLMGLAAAGVFCIRVWNEPKGARTFLGLMTAGIAVPYTQVGAMLYGHFDTTSKVSTSLPEILIFKGLSAAQILIAALLVLLVLPPAVQVGLRTLSGPHARALALNFTGLCALLIIPARSSIAVSGLVMIQTIFWGFAYFRLRRDRIYGTTPEARIALAIMSAPLWIMAARGLFYDADQYLLSVLGVLMGSALVYCNAAMNLSRPLKALAQMGSAVLFLAVALEWQSDVTAWKLFPEWVHTALVLLPFAVLMILLERRASYVRGFRYTGIALIVLSDLILSIAHFQLAPMIAVMVTGFFVIAVACDARDRESFLLGVMITMGGVLGQCWMGFKLLNTWPWLSLALTGFGILLVA
ncbi:MAG: hypothetical protein AB7P49_19820, partial [Bdellovibrionales bacterium]